MAKRAQYPEAHPEVQNNQKKSEIERKANQRQTLGRQTVELQTIDCGCQVKAQIIHVAAERFKHYGYGKTTISDIASDCSMSAGNIYRYFDSKLDIATAIIQNITQTVLDKVSYKVEQTNRAQDKLRALLFESLKTTYHILEDNPKLAHMMLAVYKEHPQMRRQARKAERRLIAQILKYGKQTNEFHIDCTASAAQIIQCLVSRFRWSKLRVPDMNFKRLETELEGTFAMIITALSAGCILGKIMRRHSKLKQTSFNYPSSPNQTIPFPQGFVF